MILQATRSRSLSVGLLALLLASPPSAQAEPPPRPALEDRLRLIHSHPRLPVLPEPPPEPASGQEDFDVTNYTLTVAPYAWEGRLEGSVAVTFKAVPGVSAVTELVLDLAPEMTVPSGGITRRSVPGAVLPFTHDDGVLRIDLTRVGAAVPAGTYEVVTVAYSGRPRQDGGVGLQFSVFGRFPDHVPSIYTLSEPYRARTWWPCKDTPSDKATATIRIQASEELTAVANGVLLGILPGSGDGNRLTVWRERSAIATYLIGFALSDYVTCEAEYVSPLDASVATPVTSWAWPSRIGEACAKWEATPDILAEFARTFGEYPFASEKYANVAIQPLPRNSPYVAMENQTCSFIGAGWLPLQHETLLAHEIAHHWWGNSLTPRDFTSIWLNEGFATYAEALWWESQHGRQEYLGYMRDLDALRTTGEFVGPVDDPLDADGDGWPDGDASGPELTVYFKGAWVLHMLRWVLSLPNDPGAPERIERLFREWHASRSLGTAATADFVEFADVLATNAYGQRDGLLWFFDQWLTRDDRPCYRVGWSAVPTLDRAWSLQLVVDQARWGRDEDTGALTCADDLPSPYRMPVAVDVELDGGGRMRLLVDSRDSRQSFSFRVPAQPVGVVWDPDGWILKAVQLVDADGDDDGWADPFDSCPLVPDPDQRDDDGDGVGDACQDGIDFDGDGRPNEADCAPADSGAWTPSADLADVEIFVSRGDDGLVVRHGAPPQAAAGERAIVLDVAQGRLDRLSVNRSFSDAACTESSRIAAGELTIPWASLTGNRYVVLLPFNGCGPVDPDGRLDDPCR